MKKVLLAQCTSILILTASLSRLAIVHAAEIQVLAGGAMTGPLKELGAKFESATGNKLVFRFGTTPELIKLVTILGGPFDLCYRATRGLQRRVR